MWRQGCGKPGSTHRGWERKKCSQTGERRVTVWPSHSSLRYMPRRTEWRGHRTETYTQIRPAARKWNQAQVHVLKNRNKRATPTQHTPPGPSRRHPGPTRPATRTPCATRGRQSQKAFVYESIYKFPGSSASKESACSVGELGLIPGPGRSSGERNGNPLQYFCLENTVDRGAWRAIVHGVARYDLVTKPPSKSWNLVKSLFNKLSYSLFNFLPFSLAYTLAVHHLIQSYFG